MALFKGTFITAISGKVGGLVFSHNKGGVYVRQLTIPTNPGTQLQVSVRATMSSLSDQWRDVLTQAQRDAWDLYAANTPMVNRIGEQIYISGRNHYIRSNSVILQVGGTRVDTAPGTFGLPGQDFTMAVDSSEATQLCSIGFDDTEAWLDEDGGFLAVYQGKPVGADINFFDGPWRFAGAIAGDGVTPPTTPETVPASYPFVEGQKVHVQARILRADGRVSSLFRSNSLAVA